MLALLVAAALTASSPPRNPANWANDKSALEGDSEFPVSFKGTQEICRRLGDPEPPISDWPTSTEAAKLRGCDSIKPYYGIGGGKNFVKARQCALLRLGQKEAYYSDASMILMQVYANGFGVAKNMNLATAFSCEVDGAPLERDMRVLRVAGLAESGAEKGKPIDYCDTTTSGSATAYCQGLSNEVEDQERNRALKAEIPASALASYSNMKSAFEKFNFARATNESGNFGTGAAEMDLEQQEDGEKSFAKSLRSLLAGEWSTGTLSPDADKVLNDKYRAARKQADEHPDDYVTPQGIQETQRAWLVYRDAFVRFASEALPRLPTDAVIAHLTQERAAELNELAKPDT